MSKRSIHHQEPGVNGGGVPAPDINWGCEHCGGPFVGPGDFRAAWAEGWDAPFVLVHEEGCAESFAADCAGWGAGLRWLTEAESGVARYLWSLR